MKGFKPGDVVAFPSVFHWIFNLKISNLLFENCPRQYRNSSEEVQGHSQDENELKHCLSEEQVQPACVEHTESLTEIPVKDKI